MASRKRKLDPDAPQGEAKRAKTDAPQGDAKRAKTEEDPYVTIVVDIETSAFMRRGVRMRCLQLAWQLHSSGGTLLSAHNFYVKPEGWEVTKQASDFHGITTERAMKEGLPIKEVLTIFVGDLKQATVFVGHGIENVDLPVIKQELTDCGFHDAAHQMAKQMHVYCTMKSSTPIVQLPSPTGSYGPYKFPKLGELYEFLFVEKLEKAHDASADARATARVYFKLQELAQKTLISSA